MPEDNTRSVGWKFGDAEQEILNILLNCNIDVGEPLDRSVIENGFSTLKGREGECEAALESLAEKGLIKFEGDTVMLTLKGRSHVFGPPIA